MVPHRPGVRVEDIDAFAGALVLSERAEAQTQVRVLPLRRGDGPFGPATCSPPSWIVPSMDSPSSTWVGANAEPDPRTLRIGRTSLVTPSSVLQVDLASRAGDPPQAGARAGRLRPRSLRHVPRLGRRHRRHPRPDLGDPPSRPGAAGAVRALRLRRLRDLRSTRAFSHHRLSLLDRGVVFAIAHVRGGGEMGRAWYQDGRMEHKANTFSDFVACGRHLVECGIARSGAWPAGARRPAGSSSVPSPTRPPISLPRWWPRCPSSTV